MFMNYEVMLEFVENMLKSFNAIYSKFSFRNRFEHIKRVYNWCLLLIEQYPKCNKEAILTAAIFHDVGYSFGKENHSKTGADIFRKYASDNDFSFEFTEIVADLIYKHSNKELLSNKDSSLELIILLEADLLDEEGALGLVWDLMAEGSNNPSSYLNGLETINIHSAHILNQDFMVTPLAKMYWEKKQKFVRQFIDELTADLFLDK